MTPTRRELLAGLAAPAAALLSKPAAAAALLEKPSPVRAAGAEKTAVVVGSGVFGAWTAFHLDRRGYRVTLIDAFGPGNARASSGGESRVTRAAYGPDEIYTRFARESLPEWKGLARRSGQSLFHECGVLFLGLASDARLVTSHETLTRLGVPHAMLDRAEIGRRWPQMALDGIEVGVFEPEGGALLARRAVAALAAELEARGVTRVTASVRTPVPTGGSAHRDRHPVGRALRGRPVRLRLRPVDGQLFPEVVGPRLFVTRQEVLFFGPPPGDERFSTKALPIWMVGDFYGIPDLESRGFKVANDQHGARVDPDSRRARAERRRDRRREAVRGRGAFPPSPARPSSRRGSASTRTAPTATSSSIGIPTPRTRCSSAAAPATASSTAPRSESSPRVSSTTNRRPPIRA